MDLFDGGPDASRAGEYIRFAALLERVPVGVGIYERSGTLFYSNSLFGFRGDPVAPSMADDPTRFETRDRDGTLLPPERYPCARALAGEIVSPGMEFRYRPADGEPRWIKASAIPLQSRSAEGVAGAILVTQDVDEQHRLATALEESELRFRQFAENSRNALWIVDPASGRFDLLSAAAQALWGGGAEPLENIEQWAASIHPDDRAAAIAARARAARGDVQRFQYRVIGRGGKVARHLNETSFPIHHPSQNRMLVGSIVEDISVGADMLLYVAGTLSPAAEAVVTSLIDAKQRVKRFASASELTAMADVLAPGCGVIDLHAEPEPGPAAFLQCATARLPLILIGPADLPASRVIALMKLGAFDVVLDPLTEGELASAIVAAGRLAAPGRGGAADRPVEEIRALDRLSPREREVLDGLMDGGTNKSIARVLGISPRTVELHRARLMDRLQVRTLSELLRLALSVRRPG